MGHLINPISLRLKTFGLWQASWSNFLKRDYSYFYFISNLIQKIIIVLQNFFFKKKKFFCFSIRYFFRGSKIIFFLDLNV